MNAKLLPLLSFIVITSFLNLTSAAENTAEKVLDKNSGVVLVVQDQLQVSGHELCRALKHAVALRTKFSILNDDCKSNAKGKVHYQIQLSRTADKNVKLQVVNLLRRDDLDISTLQWTILNTAKNWRKELEKLLTHFSDYHQDEKQARMFLLSQGVADSSRLAITGNGYYIDKKEGRTIDFETAYQIFAAESERQKSYLIAGVEIMAELGYGINWYYKGRVADNPNAVDWDYHGYGHSMKKRFTTFEPLRFDDNTFTTNEMHMFSGSGYYMIARSNGLSRLQSSLVAIASSSIWEYLVEYREVVSINDQINTGWGGSIIGEVIYQMGKIFEYGPQNLPNRIMRSIFGGPEKFNSWLGNRSHSVKNLALLGFEADIPRKFDFTLASETTSGDAVGGKFKTKQLTMDGEIINIPMFERPGEASAIVTDTAFARMFADASVGRADIQKFTFLVETALAAYYKKSLSKDENGDLNGYNLIVAPSAALEIHDDVRSNGDEIESLGIVHVLGTSLDMTAYFNGFKLHCILDLYGDFAMVRSYAFQFYKKDHDLTGVQSVLEKNGYYYSKGYTTSARLEADYKRLNVGASYRKTDLYSISTRSRFYEKVTNDLQLEDLRKEKKLWVTFRLMDGVKVLFDFSKVERGGLIENYNSFAAHDTRKSIGIVYSFK